MTPAILQMLRYAFALLFGVAVSVSFAGVERTRRNHLVLWCFAAAVLLAQGSIWLLWGTSTTAKLYPLITHLPLIILIAAYLRRPWLISAVSVLSAYLCCQVPRWLGDVGGTMLGSALANDLIYLLSLLFVYYFLRKHVAGPVRQLLGKSAESCLLFGAMPLLYYLFDYGTTIYTDLLYRGAHLAVQFMPAMVAVLYFVFAIRYSAETEKQAYAQRERDLLAAQLRQAEMEFSSLRQMQQNAAAYRHDLRHHLALLQQLASDGNLEKMKDYMNAIQSDLDRITPVRFCENETVNLVLSAFASRAELAGCSLAADVKLPDELPISNTELCSLFSNGLENAIAGAAAVPEREQRTVSVKARVHKGNLLIAIINRYVGRVAMRDGLPISSAEGHGYGTRSISSIANTHAGQAIFSAEAGLFTLQVMLPLGEHYPNRLTCSGSIK